MLGVHVVLHAGPRVVLNKELEWWLHQQRMEGLLAIQSMLQRPETAVIMAVQVMLLITLIQVSLLIVTPSGRGNTVTVSDLSL